jgi:branched-chain amino acid transport system substrate-binding protein
VEQEGGKLGGVPVEVVVEDDGLRPGQGKQIAERFVKTDKMKIVTGIIFSNVALAVVPDVVDANSLYLSVNAGPSQLAGKDCHKNYFVYSWQNDPLHESAGELATKLGYKTAYVLAQNYPAGKDAVAGFKRYFKGNIVGETYTRQDQTDFAAEMAQIRAAKPEVVYQFHPGGFGIAFLKQYTQAGLLGVTPMVGGEPTLDAVTLKAVGDSALAVQISAHWNEDFDNPQNKAFVAAFRKKFNRTPTFYASQAWDAAEGLAAGLKAVKGDVATVDKLRAELKKADFKSVRGNFKFAQNQHPTQDWYQIRPEKTASGELVMKTYGKIMSNHTDPFAKDCKL